MTFFWHGPALVTAQAPLVDSDQKPFREKGLSPFTVLLACAAWAPPMALANAVAIARRHHVDGFGVLARHLFYDGGQIMALGLMMGAACAGWVKWSGPWKRFWLAPLSLASLTVGILSLPSSFSGFASRVSATQSATIVLWTCVTVGSLTVPVATFIAVRLARAGWRVVALVSSILAALLNNLVLDNDYFGIHLIVSLCSFAMGAAAMSELPWLNANWFREVTARKFLTLGAGYALTALIVPSGEALVRMSTIEGAPLARSIAALRGHFAEPVENASALDELSPAQRQWYRSREKATPVAPGSAVLGENPIVILLTIDAFRADLLKREDLAGRLPYFRKFASSAVSFDNAYSTGAATMTSLASLFSGKHYSQLLWKDGWPKNDPSIRFPEILGENGIQTFSVASKTWLKNHMGVVAGFAEEECLDHAGRDREDHPKSSEIIPIIKALLRRRDANPLFVYSHLLDAHYPYDSGIVKDGPEFSRYLSELEAIGERLAEFDAWLSQEGLAGQTTIIITADHGEAFGEHNTTRHGKSVYQELVRVPLWIRIPGILHRVTPEPVSLIDLGPTILDLFGQITPGNFMGQSLVPFVRGEDVNLTRPIVAEARLKQMLLSDDGFKAIFNIQEGSHELYNLKEDPEELRSEPDDGTSRYARLLKAFFEQHLHPSYEKHAPYRR